MNSVTVTRLEAWWFDVLSCELYQINKKRMVMVNRENVIKVDSYTEQELVCR